MGHTASRRKFVMRSKVVGVLAALLASTAMPAFGQQIITLGSFGNPQVPSAGSHPNAGVVVSGDGSTLYGTTTSGKVFSLPIGGGTPTVLASLPSGNGGDLVLSG
jgi:hypothetical protein